MHRYTKISMVVLYVQHRWWQLKIKTIIWGVRIIKSTKLKKIQKKIHQEPSSCSKTNQQTQTKIEIRYKNKNKSKNKMSNFFVGYYSVIFLTGDANGVKLRKASLMLRNKMPRKWDSWNASYAI